MNETERKAFNWLIKKGIPESNISFRARKTPDFLTTDGRGYEVKLLSDYGIYTNPKQLEELRDKNPTTLVFSPFAEEPIFAASFKDVEKLVHVYVSPEGGVVRIRNKTHIRLMLLKHLIEKREDRSVSLDEVIEKLLDKYGGVRR